MNQQHHHNLRSHPHPSESPQRTPSPTRCPICLEDLSTNTAQFLPCTHNFDLPCTITLLTGPPGPQARQCPLCRAKIAAVQYNFVSAPISSCSTHIPGSSTFDSGPFIRPDETVTPSMSEWEKNRRRTLRALRLVEDYDPSLWQLFHMGVFVREGGNVVLVERMVSLKVMQVDGTKTVALLVRSLSVKVVEKGMVEEPDLDQEEESPEDVEEAREEVRLLLKAFGVTREEGPWRDWVEMKVDDPEFKVLRDGKLLEVGARKFLVVQRKHGAEDITITNCTSLTELFPATTILSSNWADEDYDSDSNLIDGISKAARVRAVSLARQEIQGVFQLFRTLSSFEDIRDLERGSTGILDSVKQEDLECEYCEAKHRNGDCKLPKAAELTGAFLVERMAL
ncbi:uncharacterized protein LY89DRAFT_681218 [Mollisia scopiformis]|uniref:RING-type domain-containing protein n=1 Tax=Mollisia scopiformis TaxID=149040 RepID=A0A194XNK0_MOLSC|nr:uncharacterized protein LY89DRAFT_681218 [Mollisia scopiformis]KUJ21825.1 hypothetical protein LY89DRAFT_681218 [Mollisia scopiformis]